MPANGSPFMRSFSTLVVIAAEPQVHEKAIEARFMLGFLLAEEFGDREAAAVQFRRLAKEHPESELAQSALWMLSSKSQETPSLEGETTTPPASEEDSP